MAKGSGFSGGRGGGSASGGARASGRSFSSSGKGRSGSSQGSDASGSGAASSSAKERASNTRMWSEPASARQIAALKANGNFDGKYYSKGRAGETIGESVRASGAALPAVIPHAATGITSVSKTAAPSDLTETLKMILTAQSSVVSQGSDVQNGEVIIGHVVEAQVPDVLTRSIDRGPVSRVGALSFALLNDLEARHLQRFRAQHSSGWGAELRRETQAWADLKIKVATKLSEGHAELVSILKDAPAGTLTDPEAAASELLSNASTGDLEERHLRTFLSEHSSDWGSELRHEVEAWADARIKLAKTHALALVNMAKAQAPDAQMESPRARTSTPALTQRSSAVRSDASSSTGAGKPVDGSNRGRTYAATVASINAHGAGMSLETGERGWLHISKLRPLNGGAPVESVEDFVRVGQLLRVRGIGTTERGQIRLALVTERNANMKAVGMPERAAADVSAAPAPKSKRRGFFARLFSAGPDTGQI